MGESETSYGGGIVTERGLRTMSRWGFIIMAVWAVFLLTWGFLWPEPYAHGWWLVLELFAVGRTVCAYEGVRLGFSNFYLLVQGGAQDIGIFFLVFPWIVRFYARVSHVGLVDRILGSVTRAAERHRERLRGYGAVGLYLFVFFPVSGTGTLVGCVVGYLLGMPMRQAVPIVIAGHLSCLVFLLAFFDWLEPVLSSVNEGLGQYFAWIFLIILLAGGWLYGKIRQRYGRKEEATDFMENEDVVEASE